MGNNIVFKFFMILVASGLIGAIIYTLSSDDNAYILERLKKGHAVKKKKGIWDDLLEIIKPFTKANLKVEKRDITKQLFIKLGMSATENDIMDFENRKVLNLLVALLVSFIASIIVTVYLKTYIPDPLFLIYIMCLMICAPCLIAYKWSTVKLQKRLK